MTRVAAIAELGAEGVLRRLAAGGLSIRTGPFVCRIRTREPAIADAVARLYPGHEVLAHEHFADYEVTIARPGGPRRWIAPQVVFDMDSLRPFQPFPARQSFALLEWGLNWCIASTAHPWLVLHAAVLERGGDAVLMPAPPGSGKSTLCAAMAHRGWRLLSDELAIIDPSTGLVRGLARPINVKNQSIDVVRRELPEARLSTPVTDTHKGTIAHVAPPPDAVAAMDVPARIRWIFFPRWQADAALSVEPVSQGDTLAALIDNAFNYENHGEAGFVALAGIARRAPASRLTYAALADALAHMGGLS